MVRADGDAWPLTGRDGELAEIDAALRTASGVLLAGPAGVGKTRLAREALARDAAGPARWLTATGSAQSMPLAALAPLLSVSDGESGGVSLLVRAHAALCAEPGLVLGVDDAHREVSHFLGPRDGLT